MALTAPKQPNHQRTIPTTPKRHPSSDGTTLNNIIEENSEILDVNYDPLHSRYNISVHRNNYAKISNNLAEQISTANFKFNPTVRRVNTYPSNTSQRSNTSATTKYSQILSEMVSATASQASPDEQSTQSNRSNAWNRHIPSFIDFTSNDTTHFPPLRPTNPTSQKEPNDNSSTITASTLHSAIQDALTEMQRQHSEEIKILHTKFQTEISALREQLHNDDQQANERLETKLDKLMHHFHLRPQDHETPTEDTTPSPFRKKSRNDNFSPQDTSPSSLADSDEPVDMITDSDTNPKLTNESNNVPSSQDGNRPPSGSER